MKTILLPTDFSENSRNATAFALKLYEGANIEFILLHTYLLPASTPEYTVPMLNSLNSQSEKNLSEYASEIRKEKNGKINLIQLCEYGDLAHVICKICEKRPIDMVIMGTKGASGLKEVLFGSNTVDVIKKANVPVLVIPIEAKFCAPKNILFPSDLEEYKRPSVLNPLIEIGVKYKSEITILNVTKDNKITQVEKALEGLKLNNKLKQIPHEFKFIENNNTAKGIEDFAEMNAPDMIVMVARKNNFFERVFKKSITKPIALHTCVPLLALPDEESAQIPEPIVF